MWQLQTIFNQPFKAGYEYLFNYILAASALQVVSQQRKNQFLLKPPCMAKEGSGYIFLSRADGKYMKTAPVTNSRFSFKALSASHPRLSYEKPVRPSLITRIDIY